MTAYEITLQHLPKNHIHWDVTSEAAASYQVREINARQHGKATFEANPRGTFTVFSWGA